MRGVIWIALVGMALLGPTAPGEAAGDEGGVAAACKSATEGKVKQQIDELQGMSREQLWPSLQAALIADDKDFAALSDAEQDIFWRNFREALVKMPSVMLSFCDHLARGAVPGIGTGAGHGEMSFGWAFKFDKDGKTVADPAMPGSGDCERPYAITIAFDAGGTTTHVFCEARSGFALTSSHRAEAGDRWTRIE